MSRRSIVAAALLVSSACIAQPSFDTSSVDPSGSAIGEASEMIFISATTMPGPATAPAHHKPTHTQGNAACKPGNPGAGEKGADEKGPGKKGPGDKGPGNNGKGHGANEGNGPKGGGDTPGNGDHGDCGASPGGSGGTSSGEDGSGDHGGGDHDGGDHGGGGPRGDGAPAHPSTDGAGSGTNVVAPFWIDAREVSARDYGDCVSAGACTAAGVGEGCTAPTGLGDHPVTCVSRAQASTFCAWKQKRLVRDAEWTAASVGSAGRSFPWGDEPPAPDRLNACGRECASDGMFDGRDAYTGTAPCGSFPAGRSPDGVLDLAGNVSEWVDAPSGLVRGGSYADVDASAVSARAARFVSVDAAEPTIGFRCARDP